MISHDIEIILTHSRLTAGSYTTIPRLYAESVIIKIYTIPVTTESIYNNNKNNNNNY